jgi:pyruvate-formate lyase-activating enzyme
MEKTLIDSVLPNLKAYKDSPDYKKLTDGQKEQIDKVIVTLSTPE